MKPKFALVFALAIGVFILAVPLFAHHGTAAFDPEKRITLKGTVTQWFWANPHCFLQFDVKDDSGEVKHWVAETSNPPDMINHGWTKQSLHEGDQITVTLQPVKNGKPIGRVLEVVLPSGQKLGNGFGPVSKPQDDSKQ